MMQTIKQVTRLDPIDGLRFNVCVLLSDMFRVSSSWNYGIVLDKPFFDLCVTEFNPKQNKSSPYKDFITAEYSGHRGFTAIGSYVFPKNLGFMINGEGNIKDFTMFQNAKYFFELRKIFKQMHIGVFKKDNSFGISYLHRATPKSSYGIQLGLTVPFIKKYRMTSKK